MYSLFTSHGRGGVCINIGVVCYSSFSTSSTSTSASIRRGIVGRAACFNESSYLFHFICIFIFLAGGLWLGLFFFYFFFLCVVRLGRLGIRYYY